MSNIASSNGGAIKSSNASGKLTLAESTLNSNIALGWGGGIYAPNGELTVYNSTLANNSAAVQGGGILSAATTVVANTTLSGNSAGSAGGIRVLGGSTTLKNTIIANSSNGDCVGTLASAKNNLISTATNACGLTNGVDGNIIGFDPDLGALTGSPAYFPLKPGSLAIDAGDNATCAAALVSNQSQNGITRPKDYDGNGSIVCDIGAFEAPQSVFKIFLPLILRSP